MLRRGWVSGRETGMWPVGLRIRRRELARGFVRNIRWVGSISSIQEMALVVLDIEVVICRATALKLWALTTDANICTIGNLSIMVNHRLME